MYTLPMKNRDLVLSLVASGLTAFFLPLTLREKGINLLSSYPTYYIYVAYPLIAIVGMFVMYYLGKKLAILWQLSKFGLVGVLNTAIDFGILNYLATATGVNKGIELVPIKAVSFLIALANSYWWNKNWVFEGKKKANPVTFIIISTIGISVNVGAVFVLTSLISPPGGISEKLWLNVANVGATFLSLAWNFLGYRLVVFKK